MTDIAGTIALLGGEEAYACGIETVMTVLRPRCLYGITAQNGQYHLTHWEPNQWDDVRQCYIEPPSDQEIRDEFVRQQTIGECLRYFRERHDGTLG